MPNTPNLSVPSATLNFFPTTEGPAMHNHTTPTSSQCPPRLRGRADLTNALARKVGHDETMRRLQRHGIASMDELDNELTELLTAAQTR